MPVIKYKNPKTNQWVALGSGVLGTEIPFSEGTPENDNAWIDPASESLKYKDPATGEVKEVGAPSSSGVSLESVYPIGSIYLSVLETNPATLFGFGTWEQIKDTFLLASGDTYAAGSTGGEAEHTLTVDEIPSHTHTTTIGRSYGPESTGSSYHYSSSTSIGSYSLTTSATGGGQAHNNMPPYLAVYMWQRTE